MLIFLQECVCVCEKHVTHLLCSSGRHKEELAAMGHNYCSWQIHRKLFSVILLDMKFYLLGCFSFWRLRKSWKDERFVFKQYILFSVPQKSEIRDQHLKQAEAGGRVRRPLKSQHLVGCGALSNWNMSRMTQRGYFRSVGEQLQATVNFLRYCSHHKVWQYFWQAGTLASRSREVLEVLIGSLCHFHLLSCQAEGRKRVKVEKGRGGDERKGEKGRRKRNYWKEKLKRKWL